MNVVNNSCGCLRLGYFSMQFNLNKNLKIYIFGANSRAKSLQGYLNIIYPEIKIEAFLVDDNDENDCEIKGVPVVRLNTAIRLNTDYPVFIATKGIYHSKIEMKLNHLGMINIIPVSVEIDNELRNICTERLFTQQNKQFIKIGSVQSCALTVTKPDAKIYVVKSFFDEAVKTYYKTPDYEVSIYAGASLAGSMAKNIGVRDDSGENISYKNRQYCELTALYWIWKHAQEDIVGLAHYRRHFVLPDNWAELMAANNIDVILPVPSFVFPSISDNYCERHDASDWKFLMHYFENHEPELLQFAEKIFNDNLYFPCNMLIAKKNILNILCEWLFPIVDAVVENGGEKTDRYKNRYAGFISERLITLFFLYNEEKYNIVYADRIFLR